MSYKAHEAFMPPKDMNARIWRYIDLGQLISLLATGALFFPMTRLLDDPFEGTVPRRTAERLEESNAKRLERSPASYRSAHDWPERRAYEFNQLMCVSCWHVNDRESAAMWKLYVDSNLGVAIQSTFARLVQSLSSAAEDIHIGIVKYIDYDYDDLPGDDRLHALMHKRREFEHERELRAVANPFYQSELAEMKADTYLSLLVDPRTGIIVGPKVYTGGSLPPPIRERTGIRVSVDVAKLVGAIHVAPSAPDWFTDVVVAVVKQFGHDIPVHKSRLYRPPDFSR